MDENMYVCTSYTHQCDSNSSEFDSDSDRCDISYASIYWMLEIHYADC